MGELEIAISANYLPEVALIPLKYKAESLKLIFKYKLT